MRASALSELPLPGWDAPHAWLGIWVGPSAGRPGPRRPGHLLLQDSGGGRCAPPTPARPEGDIHKPGGSVLRARPEGPTRTPLLRTFPRSGTRNGLTPP